MTKVADCTGHRFGHKMAKQGTLHGLTQIMGLDPLNTSGIHVTGSQGAIERSVDERVSS